MLLTTSEFFLMGTHFVGLNLMGNSVLETDTGFDLNAKFSFCTLTMTRTGNCNTASSLSSLDTQAMAKCHQSQRFMFLSF